MTRNEARELLVADLGEVFTASYFDRSMFVDGLRPQLFPWSNTAAKKWRGPGLRFLRRHKIALCRTLEPGAWKEVEAA